MELNKIYRPIQAMREKFADESCGNPSMLDAIDAGGGTFKVLNLTSCSSNVYVDKIRTKNGKEYSAEGSGGAYFELGDYEFKYFEEVEVIEVEVNKEAAGGLVSMVIEVDQQNFEEMIDLIKKNFLK